MNAKTIDTRHAEILKTVAATMRGYASRPNDNWTDAVDEALTALGYKTETPDNDDPWVIAQLQQSIEGFGNVVVYREGRGDGPDAYAIIGR